MNRYWIAAMICFLTACTTATPQPTPDIASIVAATVSAERYAFYQPDLLEPEDQATFDNPSAVVLAWDWVRSPGENEFFDVRVWKAGEPAYGITWSQDTTFDLSEWLSQQEAGEFFWTVAVVEGNDGQVESLLGDAPPARRFTVLSNALPAPTATPTPEPVEIESIIKVTGGFDARIYARLEQAPTSITAITFASDGDLLALALDGRIYRLGDEDGDGVAERQTQILFNDDSSAVKLQWAAGMALYEDTIYVSDLSGISYLADEDEDGIIDQQHIIIDGLPGHAYPFHSNNGLAFDNAGKLYIAVGATSDHGPLRKEYEASILRANPDGTALEVFATGFRNPFDLAIAPDGRLFANDNGADRLDREMPFYPPEELNYVVEGRDYGFPDVFGDGLAIRPHGESESPIVSFPTSVVTSGLAYYAADQFPEEYHDGIFVAQYGGFNGQGREVVFVELEPTENDRYTGDWKTFARFDSGGHPVDVTVGPDGALYIVEWETGYIFRVTYTGEG